MNAKINKRLTQKAKRIFCCLNRLQRLNYFVAIEISNVSLSRLEMFTLIELQVDTSRSIKELAELFHVNRTTISRTTANLEQRGFLSVSELKSDKSKFYKITIAGARLIKQIDKRANQILKSRLAEVGAAKLESLIRLFDTLSSAKEEPKTLGRKSDTGYRTAQRRLTRAFRLLSEKAYESDLSHIAFHALEIIDSNGTSSVTQIVNKLNSNLVTVASSVSSLVKMGYVKKVVDPFDKRSGMLTLSEEGLAVYREIEQRVTAVFIDAIKNIEDDKIEKMIVAFEEFVGVSAKRLSGIEINELVGISDRGKARLFYIKTLIEQNRGDQCAEVLFPANKICFGFFKNDQLCGVEQWSKLEIASTKVNNSKPEISLFLGSIPFELQLKLRKVAVETANKY